jgi:integrase
MAKQLTLRALAKLDKKIGRHPDGGGLFLKVMSQERRFWSYRYTLHGKETELKLGTYPEVDLEEARAIHATKAALVKNKQDPQESRRACMAPDEVRPPTFGEMADKYIASHEGAWKNAKHRQQWRNTIATYCTPLLRIPVDQIKTPAVHEALSSIWLDKPETARRVRGRIETILNFAQVLGHIDPDKANPARWKDHLKLALPKSKRLSRGHHKALPYADAPTFMSRLRATPGVAARALEFTVLTAKRTNEVLGMSRFDAAIAVATGVWTIPDERMKAGVEHNEPLTRRAIEILERQLETIGDNVYVFPGAQEGWPLSDMAMTMILRRMKIDATVHGFRSTFRDWAGDKTSFPREVAEQALAHAVGDQTEAAYRRSNALEKRRDLMELWNRYLEGDAGAEVIAIREAAA